VTLQDANAGEAAGLSSKEAAEVLRYWQALLRYEEALSSRPRARRPATNAPAPTDLAAPVPGQDYMKVPFGGAERFLVEQHGHLRLPLDAERLAFFQHWLATNGSGFWPDLVRFAVADDQQRLATAKVLGSQLIAAELQGSAVQSPRLRARYRG